MKNSKATKTAKPEPKAAAPAPETKKAAHAYKLAKNGNVGKYAPASHAGAVLQVLKGGKAMTASEISAAIEAGKLLKESAMDIGKATSWILWKLKKSEGIVSA